MRTLLIGSVLLAACGSKPAPATTEDLWKLAPEKATMGFVIDAPTGDAVRATLRLVQTALKQSPTPALADELVKALTFEDVLLISDESLRNSGVEPSGGMGFFSVGDQADAGAMRLADHALFSKAWGDSGTCERRGTLNACADTKAVLATMGKPSALADEIRRRPAELRGGAEGKIPTDDGVIDVGATATRGRVAMRLKMTMPGLPSFGALEAHPLVHHVAAAPASGVFIADLRGVLATMANEADAMPDELKAVRGDLIAAALRGDTTRAWIRVGIADKDAARALLARCEELSGFMAMKVTRKGDTCEVVSEKATMHVRIDGDTFLAESAPGVAAEKGTPDPRITELLSERWMLAAWGHGLGRAPSMLANLTAGAIDASWWMTHVYEIGFAMRIENDHVATRTELGTVWQDDDALLAKLEPVLARVAKGEEGRDALAALAKEFPKSHLATHLAAGDGGLQVPVMALALGAFMYISFSEEEGAHPAEAAAEDAE
jgi:hypothetical protein